MKPTDKLQYPDFTMPGLIVLTVGVAFAAFQFTLNHDFYGWILTSMLISAGGLMLARKKLGTIMLAGGILYGVYSRIFIKGLSDVGLTQTALSVFILLGLLSCLCGQIRYFTAESKSEQNLQNQDA